MIFRYTLPAIALVLCTHAAAQLATENLITRMPDGYKVDHRDRGGPIAIIVMVPQSENMKDWNEILTAQTFKGKASVELAPFMDDMRERAMASCKEPATYSEVGVGAENGYAFIMWSMDCPKSSTGQPEFSWYKAIKGNDSFYLVTRSFRKDPTQPQEAKLIEYFKTVIVCDPRLPGQACPKG